MANDVKCVREASPLIPASFRRGAKACASRCGGTSQSSLDLRQATIDTEGGQGRSFLAVATPRFTSAGLCRITLDSFRSIMLTFSSSISHGAMMAGRPQERSGKRLCSDRASRRGQQSGAWCCKPTQVESYETTPSPWPE